MLKICLSKNIQKSKFNDMTHSWGRELVEGFKNEENFEICIAKIANLRKQLGQSINFHN